MRRFTILFILSTVCLLAYPQYVDSLGVLPSLNQREMQLVMQQWLRTGNAAGMVFNQVNKGGFTTLERSFDQGNHHRVQEGSSNSSLRFSSDGYSRFNDNLFARGSFSFVKHDEKDRGWSDVLRTYNANPYIFGSSVRGDYDTQLFDLTLQVYMLPRGRLNAGFTIDYRVADISRQRDPRSRSYFIDYTISPAITYKVSARSKLGLNAFYRYDKERTPNLTTVQTDPNLQYYTFSGVEYAAGRIGGYRAFQRQFISDYVGVALQYQYETDAMSLLLASGADKQWQQTLGDKKQSPGSYNAYHFHTTANLILKRDISVNQILLTSRLKNGGADEYRQRLHTIRDSITGISTEFWITDYVYKNRFVVYTSDLNISWKRYAYKPNQKEFAWTVGAEAGWQDFANIYYLPRSDYAASRMYAGVNGSWYLYEHNHHRLELLPLVRAGFALKSKLDISSDTEIANFVLKPDIEFHKRNSWELAGSLKYTFPMQFAKNNPMSGYARLYAGNLFAGQNHHRLSFSLAIGLLTL